MFNSSRPCGTRTRSAGRYTRAELDALAKSLGVPYVGMTMDKVCSDLRSRGVILPQTPPITPVIAPRHPAIEPTVKAVTSSEEPTFKPTTITKPPPVAKPLENYVIPRKHPRTTVGFDNVRNFQNFVPDFEHIPVDFRIPLPRYVSSHVTLFDLMMTQLPLMQGRVEIAPCFLELSFTGHKYVWDHYSSDAWSFLRHHSDAQACRLRFDKPTVINLSLHKSVIAAGIGRPSTTGHANLLFVNTATKKIELFEPHGWAEWSEDVVKQIRRLCGGLLPQWPVDVPGAFCPRGPQVAMREFDDGFCTVFAQLYAVYRILNPTVDSQRLVEWMSRGTPAEAGYRMYQVFGYISELLRKQPPDVKRQVNLRMQPPRVVPRMNPPRRRQGRRHKSQRRGSG